MKQSQISGFALFIVNSILVDSFQTKEHLFTFTSYQMPTEDAFQGVIQFIEDHLAHKI